MLYFVDLINHSGILLRWFTLPNRKPLKMNQALLVNKAGVALYSVAPVASDVL